MDEKVKTIIKNAFKENGMENTPINSFKLEGNFQNDIYIVNETSILKVFKGSDAQQHYLNEIEFTNEFSTKLHLPKVEAHSHSTDDVFYIFYDKIIGSSLASFWFSISDEQRREIINNLMEQLQDVHEKEEKEYNWSSYITSRIDSSIKKIKLDKIFKEKEIKEVKLAIKKIPELLSKNPKFARLHNDINFYNIYYDIHNCVLIDFEESMIGPIDYDLRQLMRLSIYPKSFLKTEDKNSKVDDLSNLKEWILEAYPEISRIDNLEERFAIYDLEYYLEILSKTKLPTEQRKISKKAFKAALIINKYSTLTYDSIKNESELMQYMEIFITHGWMNKNGKIEKSEIDYDKYISMSVKDTIKHRVGTSIEQANLAYNKFKNLGLDSKIYVVLDDNNTIYAYTIFSFKNNWYYFEHYNKKLKGIKKYDTLKDAVKMIEFLVSSELKLKNAESIETGMIPEKLSYNEIIDYVKDKKKIKG